MVANLLYGKTVTYNQLFKKKTKYPVTESSVNYTMRVVDNKGEDRVL